ncbi:MAG: cytochrome c3 family protein, partial [Acidobacteriales bacterium]|nr:cytochrome c3 family protein [Terriglobales bacterium]
MVATPPSAQDLNKSRPAQSQSQLQGNTRSPHGNLNVPCQNCHTFSAWKPIRSIPEFNHNQTRYPLRGMHKDVACTQCHTKLIFTDVGHACADCHADIHRGQMKGSCDQCHTVNGWKTSLDAIQQHQNRFPLLGAHATLECDACHTGAASGRFTGLSTACISCHAKEFTSSSTVPNHQAFGFSTDCMQCHRGFDTWLGARFDHAKVTGYALTGAHATLDCIACHANNRYKGTPTQCLGCHQKDYNGTNNPPHAQAGFGTTCEQCHNTTSWTQATFDHNQTPFPLTGAHVSVPCSQCHANGNFTTAPLQCVGCHQKDYNGTNNPPHSQAGFGTSCEQCHNTTTWANAAFDHNKTPFPLTGFHTQVACTQCHVNNQFVGTPTQCVACHQKDYNGTNNPPHAQAGFSTSCEQCHNTASWAGAVFDHSKTPFPLTGFHTTVACTACHVNNQFVGTPTQCSACHMADYNGTTNPAHKAAGFPLSCEQCHTTASWLGAVFDHNKTPFPLTGFHVTVQCTACHTTSNFAATPTQCSACHIADYNGTNNPPHKAAGFATTCEQCHDTTSWLNAVFNHNAMMPFPLTGFHTQVPCTQCHVNNVFVGTP